MGCTCTHSLLSNIGHTNLIHTIYELRLSACCKIFFSASIERWTFHSMERHEKIDFSCYGSLFNPRKIELYGLCILKRQHKGFPNLRILQLGHRSSPTYVLPLVGLYNNQNRDFFLFSTT